MVKVLDTFVRGDDQRPSPFTRDEARRITADITKASKLACNVDRRGGT